MNSFLKGRTWADQLLLHGGMLAGQFFLQQKLCTHSQVMLHPWNFSSLEEVGCKQSHYLPPLRGCYKDYIVTTRISWRAQKALHMYKNMALFSLVIRSLPQRAYHLHSSGWGDNVGN